MLAGVSPPQRERVARSESSFDRAYTRKCTSHFSVRLTPAALRSENAQSARVLRECKAQCDRRGLCVCRRSVQLARMHSPWQRRARCILKFVICVIAAVHVISIATDEALGSRAQLSLDAFVLQRRAACRSLEGELFQAIHRVIPRVGQWADWEAYASRHQYRESGLLGSLMPATHSLGFQIEEPAHLRLRMSAFATSIDYRVSLYLWKYFSCVLTSAMTFTSTCENCELSALNTIIRIGRLVSM